MALFSSAAAIAPAKSGKAVKPAKKEIPIEGLLSFAQIDAAIKALEGLKGTYESKVKGAAMTCFLGFSGNERPDSFTGIDGAVNEATASMELRKRGTNSALNAEQVALLQAHGIQPLREVTCRELYAINPKYAGDGELLGKVETALESIVPTDFIVKQDEISKMVVTDANVDAVFAAKSTLSAADFEAMVKVVTTQAVKAKLAKTDFNEIMAAVAAMLQADDSEVEEA